MKLIAKTLEGFEEILEAELRHLGAEDIILLKRAVMFTGNKQILYKVNLMSRTLLKLLVVMKEFEINSDEDLYENVKKIDWEEYMGLNDTFAIDSVVNSEQFRHSNFISLKTKDAIVDRFRDKFGQRPNVDTSNPTLRINVHIRDNKVTLSLDSSGRSLHMRGYRKQNVEAPLNEVMAAGIVLLSGWDQKSTLIDPMCGSATILCEAAKIAMQIPPHDPNRDFTFKNWKSFDEELWNMVCSDALALKKENCPDILGFDNNQKAINASKANIDAAGLTNFITISEEDFFYQEGTQNATLIFNPPYDGRLKEEDVIEFYKFIGDKLKHSFKSCSAWILSGNLIAIKNLGLKPSFKKNLLNGSIPSILCKFEMYDGSKKKKWKDLYGANGENQN